MNRTLLLNATFEPLCLVSFRRAIVLVLKDKAEVLERAARHLRSATAHHASPLVIRLRYFVRVPRHESRKISRRAVFARDGYECQYCGAASHLTMDHVIPRSRGGGSSWDNVVTSCAPCNLRKGNRLPHEINMHPRTTPRPPRPDVFISVAAPRQPNAWLPYLTASAA